MNVLTVEGKEVFINTFGVSDAMHNFTEMNGKPVTCVYMISGNVYDLYREEFDKLYQKEEVINKVDKDVNEPLVESTVKKVKGK